MNEIYYCRRIWKESPFDINKGDIGYVEEHLLPEIISRSRFFLYDVIAWEEYKQGDNMPLFFKTKEPLVRIKFKQGPDATIFLSLEEFDKVMEMYYSSKIQIKLN